MNTVSSKANSTRFAFILVTSLFFLWGFSNNLNPILIPHLKKSFTLTTTQSTLIDSAVYIAYFLMALPAGYVIKRFGYKIGIITGLIFFSGGAFLFIPAANMQSYVFLHLPSKFSNIFLTFMGYLTDYQLTYIFSLL